MEAATLKDTTASGIRSCISSRDRGAPAVNFAWSVISLSIAISFAILANAATLCASTAPPQKIVSQRTARTLPHRFTITPTATTLAANQVQHFGVTDAEGNLVAVTWNLSGIGCAGIECGTIDADGNYRPPASLRQPRTVILEGVVASDPNYSVLTRIQLLPSSVSGSGTVRSLAAVPASSRAAETSSVPAMQSISSPTTGRTKQTVDSDLLPLPGAISSAPEAQKQSLTTHNDLPLPHVIAAPPSVAGTSLVARETLPALTNAVGAAPTIGNSVADQRSTRAESPLAANAVAPTPAPPASRLYAPKDALPLPNAVDAPVAAGPRGLSPHEELPALPTATAASKHEDKGIEPAKTSADSLASSNLSSPRNPKPKKAAKDKPKDDELAVVVGPVPVFQKDLTPRTGMPVAAVAPAPSLGTNVESGRVGLPLLQPVTAAPSPEKNERSMELKQVGSATLVTPQSSVSDTKTVIHKDDPGSSTKTLASAMVSRESSASEGIVPAPSKSPVTSELGGMSATAHGAPVRYLGGELTIDANNETMASILELIAKKTGAVIEVPEGTGQEHIFEHAGPGKPNDVLTQLLNGSHYNFIIVNSPLDPNAPAQVLLTVQRADATLDVPPPVSPTVTPGLYTPPDPTLRPQVLGAQYDSTLQAPSEPVTPEALGEMMKEKARQLRDRTEQQSPPQ